MSQENVELGYRVFEAFNRRDLEGFLALMDEDVEAISRLAAVEGGYHGHEGIRRWWNTLLDAIPDELIEAARVDGASMLRTFWTVAVPAARPAMAILFLFTFMTVWTDYMWPLVALKDNQTLQVALDELAITGQGQTTDYALVLCGTGLATIPLLILFILSGRQLVAGIMQGAVKG